MSLLTEPWRLFFLLAGPFAGTLVATFAVSWPRPPKPLLGTSTCGRCGVEIPLHRQAPLFSWLASGGARPCCDGKIPSSYPLGDAAGLAVGVSTLAARNAFEGGLLFLAGLALTYAALVDCRRFVIPAQAIAFTAGAGILLHLSRADYPALIDGLFAAGGMGAMFEVLRRASKGAALGLGDGLLAASVTIWLGWELAPPYIAMAAGLCLGMVALARIKGRIAFGAALAGVGYAAIVLRMCTE